MSISAKSDTRDAGAIALLRCLPDEDLPDMYRKAKSIETDKGQHAACLIGREIIRRTMGAKEKS